MPCVTLRRPGIPVGPGAWDRAYLWVPPWRSREIRRLKDLKELWDAELLPEIEYRDAVRLVLGLSPIGVAPIATTTVATALEASAATPSKAGRRRDRQRNLYVVGSVLGAADSQD
jgi:hypothetical protein